jgi:hypothetical protein
MHKNTTSPLPTPPWSGLPTREDLLITARRAAVLDAKVSVDVAVRHMPEKALCAPEGAVIFDPRPVAAMRITFKVGI